MMALQTCEVEVTIVPLLAYYHRVLKFLISYIKKKYATFVNTIL